ncbi:Membrane-bound metal-dependent hydrolase [Pseudodesulfovibrio profundus]|uniref:Membrane-bound metal-dependent hydrolase n=1 Tax=Pseudodesulfovibrio profundus TaxID=57320 RepID=A0A2C8F3Q0_9BACT|nr:metal-dependent hydrolase [Pseudodesulfovibrio profundus]SOB57024.1 Membrane-bound metal-dependent hydrolase [Pseudodesulfovibrio profundus]
MDPITHLSSGLMGALAARPYFPKSRYFIPLCLLASWIPDGDIFFGNGDPEFSLLHHRGITTSFFGGAILAFAMAWLIKRAMPTTSFGRSFVLSYFLICTHIWLDLITTYGTQILAPFSNHRFALDGAFIIDPLFTGIALLIIVGALIYKKSRSRIALLGMLWFFLYPLTNMGISAHLATKYAERLNQQGIPYEHVHVTPDALAPKYWKVVTTTGHMYMQDTIVLFGDKGNIQPERYRRADEGMLKTLGEQDSMFRTYAWFAKWPHMTQKTTPEGKEITFGDLRFQSTNPVLKRIFQDRQPPFTLTAYLDEDGVLTGWKFIKGASSIGETTER